MNDIIDTLLKFKAREGSTIMEYGEDLRIRQQDIRNGGIGIGFNSKIKCLFYNCIHKIKENFKNREDVDETTLDLISNLEKVKTISFID